LKENNRLKILISAYACEPNKGSEPGVGWNFVKQISQYHQLWVITRANNQKAIEDKLKKHSLENVTWIFYDLPKWLKFWKKGNRGIHLYYYLWQIGISILAKRLSKQIKFDLVHHITFVMYWLPSFLWRLRIPFIWGPIGGGETTPQTFVKSMDFSGRFHERMRRLVQYLLEHDYAVRKLAKKASVTLATTEETANRLKNLKTPNIRLCSQVALSKQEIFELDIKHLNHKTFRFLSVGNLFHLKGFHLSITAFKKFFDKSKHGEYWIIGKGPEKEKLKKLIRVYKLENQIFLKGGIPRKEVFDSYSKCDVFIQSGLHDSGGFASIEAMTARLPVICLDLGGPALQVTEDTGIKIPAKSPEQVINDMADAMFKLAADPELCWKMGEAGRQRVIDHFNWEKKADFFNQIYQEILTKS